VKKKRAEMKRTQMNRKKKKKCWTRQTNGECEGRGKEKTKRGYCANENNRQANKPTNPTKTMAHHNDPHKIIIILIIIIRRQRRTIKL